MTRSIRADGARTLLRWPVRSPAAGALPHPRVLTHSPFWRTERALLLAAVAAAFVGAALAAGIMWYMMVFDGFDYTRESWYAIPVLWGYVLFALWVTVQQRLIGGIALLLSAYLTSTYFADVYGYVPGAVVAVVALDLLRRETLGWIERTRTNARRERA